MPHQMLPMKILGHPGVQNRDAGEWLQIDLEESKTVNAIQVNFGNYGSTYYDADREACEIYLTNICWSTR